MRENRRQLWPVLLIIGFVLALVAAVVVMSESLGFSSSHGMSAFLARPTATRTSRPGRVILNSAGTLTAAAQPFSLAPSQTPSPTSPVLSSSVTQPPIPSSAPELTSPSPVSTEAPVTVTPTKPVGLPSSTSIPYSPADPTMTPFSPTVMSTATPSGTSKPPTASPTSSPQATDAPPTPTNTQQPSVTPTSTPIPYARVTGRVLLEGAPVPAGVTVKLENLSYAIVATSLTDAQGTFEFSDLGFGSGLNLLFAQEWNEQYDMSQVVSWAWMGPVTLSEGGDLVLPDLEIGLFEFSPISPPPGASLSADEISDQNPLIFEWAAYPGGSEYWVELARGDELIPVWGSSPVSSTSVAFDGTLRDGTHITADTYWWNVGARRPVAGYQLTVYGYLPALDITP